MGGDNHSDRGADVTDTGLAAFVRARLDEDQADAERGYLHAEPIPGYDGQDQRTTAGLPPAVAARVLRDVAAKRRIVDEHQPQWSIVEWPHDQNGRGEAQVCPRCQNAEHTEWNPPAGQVSDLPPDFVASYELAPCRTLRLLAAVYDDHPDYRKEWRPKG